MPGGLWRSQNPARLLDTFKTPCFLEVPMIVRVNIYCLFWGVDVTRSLNDYGESAPSKNRGEKETPWFFKVSSSSHLILIEGGT